MHARRVVLAICAAVGMLCTFLPWMNVPLSGAVYGVSRGEGWVTFALCAGALVCALAGALRSRLPTHLLVIAALIGCVVCAVGLWKIFQLTSVVPDNGVVGTVSVGIGLYLLVPTGVAMALLPALIRAAPRQSQRGFNG